MGDFQKRVETATAVFKEWEKTDREAATNVLAQADRIKSRNVEIEDLTG